MNNLFKKVPRKLFNGMLHISQIISRFFSILGKCTVIAISFKFTRFILFFLFKYGHLCGLLYFVSGSFFGNLLSAGVRIQAPDNFCIVLYSVMQSDGKSFGGDVVSNSFNKTFRDEDNNLDQIYKSKYVRIIFMMILILLILYENAY